MSTSKTKHQKKSRHNANHLAQETFGTVPHTFVFHRGRIGKNVGQLVADMRRVMEPYTAESLKVRKKNVLKDFVTVAGPLGVTHFLIFTKTPSTVNLRLARLPKGPTLYFRVAKYSLIKDVVSSLKRHRMHEQQFTHHPLLVLNNFGVEGMQVKLMATMFQNMFPSINVHKVNLNAIKRCVLFNYDPLSQEVEFRHYSLKVVPVGMSRGVKKLMQEKFPNMSKLEDISELLMKGANLSESEAENDGDHNITELPQVYSGRGNMRSEQSAVRLTEIGPRMTLQLVKIEEGMGEGNVLYHSLMSKTEEELQEILSKKEARLKEKVERKRKQEHNVALKKEKRDENKKKSLQGIKRKQQQDGAGSDDGDVEDPGMQEDQVVAEEPEDEAEYYRQAVGEEPDEDMFPSAKRKRGPDKSHKPFKKMRPSTAKAPQDGPSDARMKNKPHPKAPGKSFGKTFGGKRFGGKKMGETGKKFGKGEGSKAFGVGRKRDGGKTFGGKKSGERGSNFKKAVVAEEDQKTREMNVSTQNCSADPPWQLFPLIYSAEFCVALLGNTFALWQLVTRERKNWHTGVVFSCNLAISDLLYILTLPLIIISYAHQKVWTFGATACKVERFLFTCNLYASISFIMCISVNRYVAIAYPLLTRSYLRPKHAKVASLLVWFSAIVLSSPVFAYANTSPRNNDLRCLSYSSTDVNQHFHYRVCLLVLGFLMPLVVTMASYCGVMWVVFKNANITHLEKKKVALMVGSVCVLYAVSFVPYHVLQTYKFYLWKSTKVCWVKKAYQVTTVLAPLNMCIHPILYMAVSDSIRTACCRRGSDE